MRPLKDAHRQFVLFMLSVSLLLAACGSLIVETPVPITAAPTTDLSLLPWLQVYFTDPTAPTARDYEGGPDQVLASAIDSARLSVDVAAYSLNLWSIRDALLHARQRGVVVRMVMETDNMDVPEVQDLLDAGIPIISDQQAGLMHNKYIIIDRSEVWTGSLNYTVSGAYKDNNNLIRIRSAQVAEDYTKDFEKMFTHKLFGPEGIASTPNPALTINRTPTPHPTLTIEGTRVEIYFPPADNVVKRIVELIQGAKQNIYYLSYLFMADDIGKAIYNESQAGVTVSGVVDAAQAKIGVPVPGFDELADGNTNGALNDNVIIIDQKIVITGSYNFAPSAEQNNDENVVIIFDPDTAARYMEEFWNMYNHAQTQWPSPEFPPGPTSKEPTPPLVP